jgi:hypothetical protein
MDYEDGAKRSDAITGWSYYLLLVLRFNDYLALPVDSGSR